MLNSFDSREIEYESPVVEVIYIQAEVLCTSPGAGGSEGTDDENWMSN